MPPSPADRAKRAAAAALELVQDGMKLGLGSGSTAAFFVELLAGKVAETGWSVTCASTSSGTRALAERMGLAITDIDDVDGLDLAVDGADELDDSLDLIKGGGGALLLEKIVAHASARFVVIADPSKDVGTLGAFPLPVEVVRFGWRTTARHIAEALRASDVDGREVRLRERDGRPFVTDEGHHVLDLHLGRIGDPGVLEFDLVQIPGVVDTGLFLGMADMAILGHEDGTTRTIEREA